MEPTPEPHGGAREPLEALAAYELANVSSITPISVGRINETWLVTAERGRFVLQRVNELFDAAVMDDITATLEHLQRQGCTVMAVQRTRTGELSLAEGDRFWRLVTWIDGVTETKPSIQNAAAAGALLGQYHRLLQTVPHQFRTPRTMVHNVPALAAAYEQARAQLHEPDFEATLTLIDRYPSFSLPSDLPHHVLHGDPKITNVLFSRDQPTTAVTMVDWDDVGPSANVLHELGEFFRSFTRVKHGGRTAFSLEQFHAAWTAYDRSSHQLLTQPERSLLPQAIELKSLELAARAVTDMVEDHLFGWDTDRYPSRRASNRARAEWCVELFDSFQSQRAEVERVMATDRPPNLR